MGTRANSAQGAPAARIASLDALRGLAALSVLVFHYTTQFPRFYAEAPPAPFSFEFGYFGVHLFFMISGLVIMMSLDQSRGRGFVRSRVIRLYPVFWASVLLTALVLSFDARIADDVSPGVVAINLTMLHDYLRAPMIDGVYWSLSYELGFYAFLYALARLAKGDRLARWAPLYLATAAAAFPLLKPFIPHPMHYVLMINAYAHLFAVGLAFYFLRREGRKAMFLAPALAAPAIQYLYDGWPGALAVGLSGALVGAALFVVNDAARWSEPLRRLGVISYALYLVHQMIGYVIIAQLQRAGLGAGASIAAATGLVVALAAALTYGVERPAARALKKRWRARLPAGSGQAQP